MPKPSATAAKLTPAALQAQLQQAIGLHQHGFMAQAEVLYREILAARPAQFEALHLLGVLCVQSKRTLEGIELIRRSIAINGYQSAPHSNLGNALMEVGQYEEAVQSYNKAVALKPDYAEAYSNRGNALRELGRAKDAVASYDKALAIRPHLAEAHSNRGNALRQLQRHEEAIASYDQAIALRPDYAEAHMNRGTTLTDLHRYDEALASYDQAIAFNPAYSEAYTNRGNALREQGQFDAAVASHRRAIELAPGNEEAHGNLGVVYQEVGLGRLAAEAYRQALAINPHKLRLHSGLLFTLSHLPATDPQAYLAEARRYGAQAAAQARPGNAERAPRTPGQALRVGFVSGDFKNHPVGYFLETFLAHMDPSRVELVAYATQPREDDLTRRLKPLFREWRVIAGLNDAAAARLIVDDRIDVLMDLAGHTADNRLPLFAWKPAPVQASWLGFFASTGVEAIDYVLADEVCVPPAIADQFSERLWALPDTRLCLSPPQTGADLPVAATPALAKGHVTFGCFQNLGRIHEGVLQAWGRIMAQVPEAQLYIHNKQMGQDASRDEFLSRLADVGIAAERVRIDGPMSREDYLACYANADILLDTFPYAGCTTTCEALWMGAPTVTLAGDTMLSRQGVSIMTCAGLPDWVGQDIDGYVARAVHHASDIERLAALRAGLRAQVSASPLFDAPLFASRFERALLGMAAAQEAG